jgi:hypothetical protein
MKFRIILLLALALFLYGDDKSGIYEPPCCSGSWYDPPGTVLTEVTLNRPSAGNSVKDTTFGTTITALPGGARNTYSQLQVWSHDNRYMITVNPDSGYYEVRDANTFALLYLIPHSSPRWLPGTHKVISVDNEPGRIFTYNVDTSKEEVLMTLPYRFITSSVSYEELSRDGHWMSLYIANDGSGNIRLLTVNLVEKRIAMNRKLQDMCAPDPQWGLLEPDWIGVSPNGNYAVVQWARDGTTLCSGMELYDIETGLFVRRIHTHHSHSDLGLAEDGREVLVSFELAHPDNNNYPAIVLYWLDGSPKKYLRMVPWFRLDHVSCQGPKGVWLVTAGRGTGNPLLQGELYVVYQDGSLRRIVHHRSDSCDYWAQPKATISLDGTRVAFSSNWGGNCSQAGGFVVQNLKLTDTSTPPPPPPTPTPTISLNRGTLTFGAVAGTNASGTETQSFSIRNSGQGTLNWNISDNAPWLSTGPGSGSGSAQVSVTVNPSNLSAGTYNGTVTVADSNASNSPQTVSVTLNVYTQGQDSPPFGSFDTPLQGAVVRSSIAVTGWALDDIGVGNVKIFRLDGAQEVYIGDAVSVEGARSDVENANPGYPNNYIAGWGYMMLTNFLPNGGNGTYTLRAAATDSSGHRVVLGSKTITCDNVNAVKPFGAIDTPGQGGIASGSSFVNWGWVLTPLPNKIPTDGSTIDVWIDGVKVGKPTYNIYRSDIAALFPDYANAKGAVGYFYLDATAYDNGVHTIQWTATDNNGNSDGIGSRYFTIQNSGSRSKSYGFNGFKVDGSEVEAASRLAPVSSAPVWIKKGYRDDAPVHTIHPDHNDTINIKIKELERLEIHLVEFSPTLNHQTIKLRNLETFPLTPLPIGSTLDREKSRFVWQPGPGFIGTYDFTFLVRGNNGAMHKKKISITIGPG